jgi:hypothetical protein
VRGGLKLHENCGPRVEASSSVFLSCAPVVSALSKEGKVRGGWLVVVCSSKLQLVICCQSAPTLLCTSSWPLADSGLDRLKLNSAQGYVRIGLVQREQPVVGCFVIDVSKESSVSVFDGQGDGEDGSPGDLIPHKHRCGKLDTCKDTSHHPLSSSSSDFDGRRNGEDDRPGDINPHKHRCGKLDTC